LVRSYNHTPRKCLNYQTPAEVFCHDLLHFRCESTYPPSRVWRTQAASLRSHFPTVIVEGGHEEHEVWLDRCRNPFVSRVLRGENQFLRLPEIHGEM